MFACATLLTSSCLMLVVYASPFSALFESDLRGGGVWNLDSVFCTEPPSFAFFLYVYFLGDINSSLWVRCFVSNSLMEVVVETPLRHPNNLLAKNETLSLILI